MDGKPVLQVEAETFDRETALAPPPTSDDVTVLSDGRRLDTVAVARSRRRGTPIA
jgi:hypothetical protein